MTVITVTPRGFAVANMALSCSSLCRHLSLVRLCGLRTNRTTTGLYSPYLSCQSRLPLCRLYSSSKVRRGIGRYVTSRLQWANSKYEGFLKRRFPSFYQLYHTFVEGFKLLFQDAKDVRRIKAKMTSDRVKFQDLPYREMEKLRQFHRNMIKAIPLVMISIPPFANYLVFVLMYFFPRQLLIPHFWTPRQQVEFRGVYNSLRARHHWPVLKGLEDMSRQVKEGQLQSDLRHLCAKVQSGVNPKVSEILAVRRLFSGPPLGMKRMSVDHMRHISPLLFLTPRLPGFVIGRRLNSHALELLQLDRALSRLGPHQLSDAELRQACYVRGLNSDSLGVNQCREWLSQWLQVSSSLKDSEVSLLLHSIVFLSANYQNGLKWSH
ncbi:LETM1 domain-containing protein 1 [Xiphias gladius]|uniref:LETM1 domain-containing protein 1 n=1 Tax=Xiphias gladius TaxID=8245 RepID=UPI001A99160C|nr:LETM1 domain-containing protein 1 [Xiphias gladius]